MIGTEYYHYVKPSRINVKYFWKVKYHSVYGDPWSIYHSSTKHSIIIKLLAGLQQCNYRTGTTRSLHLNTTFNYIILHCHGHLTKFSSNWWDISYFLLFLYVEIVSWNKETNVELLVNLWNISQKHNSATTNPMVKLHLSLKLSLLSIVQVLKL